MIYSNLKLFKHSNSDEIVVPEKDYSDWDFVYESPSLIEVLINGKNLLQNVFLKFFSRGDFVIFKILKNGELAHYSYVSYKSYRFPFMTPSDVMIGPCLTFSDFRRKGLYFKALTFLIEEYRNKDIWIFAQENNLASLSVIEKAGFVFFSDVKLNRITKQLKLI